MRDDFDTKWPAILAKVPKGKNPFDFVQRNMSFRDHERHAGGTFSVLIILTILTFINTLVMIFCLLWILLNGREGRSRHLWFIRYVRTKDKKFVIAPNSSLFAIIFQIPSGAAALSYFYFVFKSTRYAQELNLPSTSFWFNLTFLFSYIGLWTSGWGYWSASLSRQPKDLLITDRILSSRLSAMCGAIWCLLACGLYIFIWFMMQASLNTSRESDSQLRAQLQKYARVWAKTPKAANPHDLASLFNTWRDSQHTFALWRTFTGTLQGIMSLLLCVWYIVAASALQRIQNLDNGSSQQVHLPQAFEKSSDTPKPKKPRSFKITKIELLTLYCYAMAICTLAHSFSLLVCYNLPHRLQRALSVTGDDTMLKILPLILISSLSSIETWKAVVRRKRRTPKADTELSVHPPPQWAPRPTQAKELNTFHPTHNRILSDEGTHNDTCSFDFPYPKPRVSKESTNQHFRALVDLKVDKAILKVTP